MKVQLVKDSASVILTVFIQDSSATDGSGLAGLVHTSSIVGGYVRMGGTGQALVCDEDVATEGSYQAPSAAGKVRIGTPANMRDGTYELHFHDDLFATGADILSITLGGAANMAELQIEVQLTDFNLNSANPDVNVKQISGDSTAADNLELQYDTTGLSGETFPATQAQLDQISVTGSAVNTPAESYNLTTGTQSANTYTSTAALDGTAHQHTDDGGAMDLYYQFSVGGDGVATQVTITGRINGTNDDLDGIYAWDWNSTWDRIGDFEGQAGSTDQVRTYNLFTSHTGTGANAGKVRIRFWQDAGLTSATLHVDQIFTSYSIVRRSVGYANGAIWVNTNASNTNTEVYVDGTADNPVSTWAAALNLSTSLGITDFHIINGSTISLSADSDNYSLFGDNWVLALNSQSCAGTHIEGADVSGIATGSNVNFMRCRLAEGATITVADGQFTNCGLDGTIVASAVGDYFFDRCHSGVAGSSTPVFDFGSAVGSTSLHLRHYSGGIEIKDMGDTGTDVMSLEGDGQLIIASTCSGGTIVIRGHFDITDNASGAVAVTETAAFHHNTIIDDILVDTAEIGNIASEIDTLLYSGPRGSGVYLDDAVGNTNTVVGTDGIESNPVSTIAAATTLAGSLGVQRIYLINNSAITLAQTYEGWELIGIGLGNQITLGSQDVDNTAFYFMAITGTQGGTGMLWAYDCSMTGLVSLDCLAQYCYLTGTNTVRASSLIIFDQCLSAVPGNNTPELTFSGGASAVNFRHYSGGLQINSMATGDVMSYETDGQLIVDATCTDGAVSVRGCCDITDNASGAVAITQSAAINQANINTECDTALVDAKLDHLVAVADSDDVVDDSIMAKLAAAGGDWSTFDDATDSLQALRDNQVSTRLFAGTSTSSSTSSKVYVQAGDPPSGGADNMYNNTRIVVYDGGDKTTARVNIRAVTDYDDSDPSFTLDTALDFTPGSGDVVEIFIDDTATLSALTKLATGFGSSSPDTLQGYVLSLMSKVASAPAAAGTFSPATDSIESLRERLDLITGGGFSTGTDSLTEIRDAIDTLVAPSMVGSSALSGSGLLSDLVTLIRKATNEPNTVPKYTDSDIVELIQAAMDVVLTDVHINTDHPIIIRHSITLVSGSQDYILPPGVGEILRIAKIDTGTNLPQWEAWPGSYFNPAGHGWKVEGNVLRLLQDWLSTDTLEIMYIPSADALMHKADASSATATTITFPSSVTDGTLDTRPNAYVGMVVRILSSTQNILEERVVIAYNVVTRVATLNKAWDTTPTGTIVYEVVPLFNRLIKHVVALRASMDLLSQEGNEKKIRTLERNYAMKMMAMRRSIEKRESRFPHHFDGDTWDNTMRGGFYGVPV